MAMAQEATEADKMDREEEEVNSSDSTQPRSYAGSGYRKYGTLTAVFLMAFCASWEAVGISTALPAITASLNTDKTVWIANTVLIGQLCFIPWMGSLSNIFGRKLVAYGCITLVIAGSIVAGLARTLSVMLVGRALQGVGNAGLYLLPLVIISDLVSLAKRGRYGIVIQGAWGLGSALGPYICGLLADSGSPNDWQFAFYIPACLLAIAFVLLFLFFDVKTPRDDIGEKLASMDWIGNAVFIATTVSFCLPLTMAGVFWRWSSFKVLLPLLLSLFGYTAFILYERRLTKPTMTMAVLRSLTANSAYIATTIQTINILVAVIFIPIYHQACRQQSPSSSGIALFPIFILAELVGLASGYYIAWRKRFIGINRLAWPFMIGGAIAVSFLRPDSSTAGWVLASTAVGIGLGFLSDACNVAILAALPQSLAAQALAFAAMLRYLGAVLGSTIGTTILQNRLVRTLPLAYLELSPIGEAGRRVAFAQLEGIGELAEPLQSEVKEAYANSLRAVWLWMAGLACFGLAASWVMRSLPLREEVDGEHGLKERREDKV